MIAWLPWACFALATLLVVQLLAGFALGDDEMMPTTRPVGITATVLAWLIVLTAMLNYAPQPWL